MNFMYSRIEREEFAIWLRTRPVIEAIHGLHSAVVYTPRPDLLRLRTKMAFICVSTLSRYATTHWTFSYLWKVDQLDFMRTSSYVYYVQFTYFEMYGLIQIRNVF